MSVYNKVLEQIKHYKKTVGWFLFRYAIPVLCLGVLWFYGHQTEQVFGMGFVVLHGWAVAMILAGLTCIVWKQNKNETEQQNETRTKIFVAVFIGVAIMYGLGYQTQFVFGT